MDAAKMSMAGSRKIKVGNESQMKQGKAQDSYNSRYKVVKPSAMPGSPMKKGYSSDATMSQINKMTKG
jgi:hypothetical protein